MLGLGSDWVGDVGDSPWAIVWWIVRWPVGLGLLAGAIALVFKMSPRRNQPPMSWLAFGAAVSVVGTLIVSLLLTIYLTASGGFGETYGALAGFMGVLLWAYGSSIALFYGLACAAQLEAIRAGVARRARGKGERERTRRRPGAVRHRRHASRRINMTSVAVVANTIKLPKGDAGKLKQALREAGLDPTTWIAIEKGSAATKAAAKALDRGADVVLVCGGDGTVRAASQALVGTDAALAVFPTGTANLFASAMNFPDDQSSWSTWYAAASAAPSTPAPATV